MNYLDTLFNLQGKTVVLTGGAGVLASQMANGLVKSGANVVLIGRTESSLEKLADQFKSEGYNVMTLVADVLQKTQLEEAREKILSQFGKIDVLINAAGGNMPGATISPDQTIFDLDMADFEKVNQLNLNGSVIPSLVFGKTMADQQSGVIINLSSMAADRIITRVAGYSASKAAITNFTKWMAVEMAQKFGEGIRVNAIAPGFFIGNQNRALLTNADGSYTERGNTIIQNTPMGRFGEAEELIGATLFLCSDAAKFITGVVLPVDGGFSSFSGV